MSPFASRVADSEAPCSAADEYEAHWEFWLRSLRSAYSRLVVWHTGLTTHFARSHHGAVGTSTPAGYPDGARRIAAAWRHLSFTAVIHSCHSHLSFTGTLYLGIALFGPARTLQWARYFHLVGR